jgi:dihydroorotase
MSILIINATVVNQGKVLQKDVFINNGIIEKIDGDLRHLKAKRIIDGMGKYLLPGVIDDQVHFREPGLTHKACIQTEARAAVAGGTTSFMEMPNTVPNALTQELLNDKYLIGSRTSLANYSFFMGVSNDNIDEVLRTNASEVCGLKIFMGSSTGNMLVDNEKTLENVFSKSRMLIATHCEDETIVKAFSQKYKTEYDSDAPARIHPLVRPHEACLKSSSMAMELAKRYDTRLHILHISTADEINLFRNDIPLSEKRITAEVCVHHLWFNADDYERLGNQIKCNPAIKNLADQEALFQALLDDKFDIIATDHAPHTWEEKQKNYWEAPSGLPLVQHSLLMMLDFVAKGKISIERVVEKMSHAPAECFRIDRRGYVKEGYWADLVLVDLNKPTLVEKSGLHYRCGWSPLEGYKFGACVSHTIVSGHLAYENGIFNEEQMGQRMKFLVD